MRIMLIAAKAAVGGIETRYQRMQRAFDRLGHPTLIWWRKPGPLLDEWEPDRAVGVGGLADCARAVRERGVEAILATMYEPLGFSSLRGLNGVRYFSSAQGHVSRLLTADRFDGVVAVSRWLESRQRHWSDAPTRLIYNGVDNQRFRPDPEVRLDGPPVVAWVGRAHELRLKRIDRLAAAAPRLREQGLRLWVISPTAPDQLPAELAGALVPLVERWEGLRPEQMPRMFQEVGASGGCVLSTSHSEGLPFALVEAQACGCPVIASNVRGNNEAVAESDGGALFAANLPGPALADLVAARLRRDDWPEQRLRARQRAERLFGFDQMIANYLEFLAGGLPRRGDWAAQRARLRRRFPTAAQRRENERYAADDRELITQAVAELNASGDRDLADHLRAWPGFA